MSTRSCRSILPSCTRRLDTFLQIILRHRIKDVDFLGRRISWQVAGIADTSTMSQVVVAVYRKSGLDFEDFDDFVKADSKQAAKYWSKPVDPVITWEVMSGDSCAERACRV
jgi:hypothetical protein